MATKYFNFTGRLYWANSQYGGIFTPDPKFPFYKAQLYLDPESWDTFKKSGLRLESKTDDNGDYVIFRRPTEKIIKGELQKFERPRVFFAEGIEPTKDIGNESIATCNVSVYTSAKGNGHRLESVTIKKLVEFERSENKNFVELLDDPVESVSEEMGGEDAQDSKAEFDDEVPFPAEDKPVVPPKKKPTPFRR